ncbi:TIGR02186 family protein [Candidatus Lariskella endosymbiont of Hedychridium roseum]|uniref:TIGR02186 family protein n=1 Tax=Candidatus Lariskella endosymbiont of Hedychridium roseum TaxID=3077949 RepID=UPI0030CDF6ED
MRNIRIILASLILITSLAENATGRSNITAKLSQKNIVKGYNFKQEVLSVSGKISDDNIDIIVEVYGPLATYRIWKKEKKIVFWVNSINIVIPSVYSYYSIAATNKNNKTIKSLTESINANFIRYLNEIITHHAKKFDVADTQRVFQKIQSKNGFFIRNVSQIDKKDKMFVYDIHLPASAITGKYTVKVYAVKDNKIIEIKYLTFSVHKDKLYLKLDNLATQNPLLYAGAAVFVSILISLLVGLLFKNFL